MSTYSNTYPKGWTEEQRVAAYNALTKEQLAELRQQWETPPDFWEAIDDVFDFQVDVCANEYNAKCAGYIDDDSLNTGWLDSELYRAWCNPGFSNVLPWHQKAYEQAQLHPSAVVVVIGIPGASQEWYKFAYQHACEIVDLSPRVNYLAPWPIKQTSNNRESQLFIYRKKLTTRPATRSLWRWKEEG